MQGLLLRLLMVAYWISSSHSIQGFLNARFQCPQPREFFEESLLEVLGIQRQRPEANGVSAPDSFVAFPARDPLPFNGQEFLNESRLRRTIFLGMNANREFLLTNLPRFYICLEMNATLVVIVPVVFVQLQVFTSVVNVPVILKPAGIHQSFLEIFKNAF